MSLSSYDNENSLYGSSSSSSSTTNQFITEAARFLVETASNALSPSTSLSNETAATTTSVADINATNSTIDEGLNYYDDYYDYNDNGGDYYSYDDTKDSKGGTIPLDYSVLSVGVLTLGLILFVEGSRHLIDHAAHGKPFFKGVLEMFYSELATLGLVELFVFIIIKYYDDLDKEKKEVFGDVHFAIFYTAILNAIQSCLTALFTRRNSTKLWVNTEHLELDHYVEIREEYDRVVELINQHDSEQPSGKIGKWIRNTILFIRRPGLVSRYQELRLQIRFHELRLHFLEANNLPLNLKVSDYLKRSELGVLIHLVHVSATAWLFLTGGLNLMYFLLGMIGYTTGDVNAVGLTMAATFFALMFAFIFISLILYYKMRTIFHTVIKTQVLESSDRAEGAKTQKELFWFGSPHLVISIIQFMNFGYALALAIVIMYWPYLTGFVDRYWYLIAVFGCYSVFLYIISKVLPQYTLCTSLGYLVNTRELQSTVAMHRLEEAERQQRRRLIERAIENDSVIVLAQYSSSGLEVASSVADNDSVAGTQKTVSSVVKSSSHGSLTSLNAQTETKEFLLADLIKADTKSLRSQLPDQARESLVTREEQMRARRSARKKAISDGVAAMRASFNQSSSRPNQENAVKVKSDVESQRKKRAERMAQRRATRKKAISQPGIIQGWQSITNSETQKAASRYSADDVDTEQRKKSSSDNAVIQAWQDGHAKGVEEQKTVTPEQKSINNEGDTVLTTAEDVTADVPQWKKDRAQRASLRKKERRKSLSASAVIQSWRDYPVTDDTGVPGSQDAAPAVPSHEVEPSDDESEDYMITNDGKTIPVTRSRDVVDVDNMQPPLSSLQDDLELHPVVETDREHEISLRETPDLDDIPQKVIKIADTAIVEGNAGDDQSVQRKGCEGASTEEDDQSFASDKSVGNLSDVDVVQTTRGLVTRYFDNDQLEPWHQRLTKSFSPEGLIAELKAYFHGTMYPSVSHVFGTLVVFFVIGHRVESMIAKTGVFFDASSSWGNNLAAAYWAEVGLLACFLIADFLVLVLFPPAKCKSAGDRSLVLSSVFDIVLTTVVLTLLMVAEAQRCCTNEPAESASEALLSDRDLASIGDYEFETDCSCAPWGRRTYTGLGNIEPFTSLIVLRVFRFALASLLVKKYDQSKSAKSDDANDSTDTSKENSSGNESPAHHHHGEDDHGHGHGHGGDDQGTALELWERAILEFPDIVEKRGQFSGELLQAMLGLDVSDRMHEGSNMSLTAHSENDKDEEKPNGAEKTQAEWKSHIKLAADQYSDLPAESQGLIIAGRLGKPVKSMRNLRSLDDDDDELPTVTEGTTDVNEFGDTDVGLFEFEVDEEQMEIEKTSDYSFIAPFARLVRSMRRCDRRHLPLLNKWVAVDVIMTQFEIVYFEAVDQESLCGDDGDKQQKEVCLPALNATKGGNGLRLCDVAVGRRVVGHVDLSEVIGVHVEQDNLPLSDLGLIERASPLYDQSKDIMDEYWTSLSKTSPVTSHHFARNIRWVTMKEDRLKLVTSHGTLYLRFYSDLAYAEAEKSSTVGAMENLRKDVAFQWAQTIARICGGTGQLRQMLPHYGEDNDDELRDYLQIVHFHRKEADDAQKVERGSSTADVLQRIYGDATAPTFNLEPASPSRRKLNYARSFDDDLLPSETTTPPPSRPKPLFLRSKSMGGMKLMEREKTTSPNDKPHIAIDTHEEEDASKDLENQGGF